MSRNLSQQAIMIPVAGPPQAVAGNTPVFCIQTLGQGGLQQGMMLPQACALCFCPQTGSAMAIAAPAEPVAVSMEAMASPEWGMQWPQQLQQPMQAPHPPQGHQQQPMPCQMQQQPQQQQPQPQQEQLDQQQQQQHAPPFANRIWVCPAPGGCGCVPAQMVQQFAAPQMQQQPCGPCPFGEPGQQGITNLEWGDSRGYCAESGGDWHGAYHSPQENYGPQGHDGVSVGAEWCGNAGGLGEWAYTDGNYTTGGQSSSSSSAMANVHTDRSTRPQQADHHRMGLWERANAMGFQGNANEATGEVDAPAGGERLMPPSGLRPTRLGIPAETFGAARQQRGTGSAGQEGGYGRGAGIEDAHDRLLQLRNMLNGRNRNIGVDGNNPTADAGSMSRVGHGSSSSSSGMHRGSGRDRRRLSAPSMSAGITPRDGESRSGLPRDDGLSRGHGPRHAYGYGCGPRFIQSPYGYVLGLDYPRPHDPDIEDPEDLEAYADFFEAHAHEERLPNGLLPSQLSELLFRDLTPEDYDILSLLDEGCSRPAASSRREVEKFLSEPENKQALAGQSCSICLAKFADDTSKAVVQLPCKHCFHRECICKWLVEQRFKCPLCGKSVEQTMKDATGNEEQSNSSTPHAGREG